MNTETKNTQALFDGLPCGVLSTLYYVRSAGPHISSMFSTPRPDRLEGDLEVGEYVVFKMPSGLVYHVAEQNALGLPSVTFSTVDVEEVPRLYSWEASAKTELMMHLEARVEKAEKYLAELRAQLKLRK